MRTDRQGHRLQRLSAPTHSEGHDNVICLQLARASEMIPSGCPQRASRLVSEAADIHHQRRRKGTYMGGHTLTGWSCPGRAEPAYTHARAESGMHPSQPCC
jgi:hypothetical protein